MIDNPGRRKVHSQSIPSVGGIGIIFSSVTVLVYFYFSNGLFTEISPRIISIIMGTIIIILTGIIDDIRGLSAFNKFLFQVLASMIVVVGGTTFFNIDIGWVGKYSFTSVEYILSIIYIVGITNAINLIDGLDGLAGGVAVIITGAFVGLSILSGAEQGLLLIFIPLMGSLIGFLFYNKEPARVFLGDTGSLFIGWTFGITSIVFAQKTTLTLSIAIPFIVLGLPAFDVLLVMVKRFIQKHDYSLKQRWIEMFNPDKNHIHHLLVSSGLSKKVSVYVVYFLTLITAIIGITSWIFRDKTNYLYNLIGVFFLIFIIRFIIEWRIHRKKTITRTSES